LQSTRETWKRKGVIAHLSVDHDHKTGKVRELLCAHCNTALGKLREDAAIAAAMLAYIQKHCVKT
jgi:hypothetical protein